MAFALAARAFGRAAPLLLFAALAIGAVEAVGPFHYMRRTAFLPVEFPLDYDGLQRVMDAHRDLRLYPSFWCDPGEEGSVKRTINWQLQITSARAHQSSNTAITVRKMKDCDREQSDMASEVLQPGDLDVFLARKDFERAFAGRDPEREAHCREFDMGAQQGYMCAADWQAVTPVPLRQLSQVGDNLAADFSKRRRIDFRRKGTGRISRRPAGGEVPMDPSHGPRDQTRNSTCPCRAWRAVPT